MDIYDTGRNKTGRTMERGSDFPDGAMHLVVLIFVSLTHRARC